MKILITGKNMNVGDQLKETIESKFSKLNKFFSQDTEINVTTWIEKGRKGVEGTIFAKGTIFRAEDASDDMLSSIEEVVSKLSMQLSKYKRKLQNKYKGHVNSFIFDEIPDDEIEEDENLQVVKSKRFDIKPMDVDEAVMQMELIGHSFFVFINYETESINVVYKRKDGKYGLLEPNY